MCQHWADQCRPDPVSACGGEASAGLPDLLAIALVGIYFQSPGQRPVVVRLGDLKQRHLIWGRDTPSIMV